MALVQAQVCFLDWAELMMILRQVMAQMRIPKSGLVALRDREVHHLRQQAAWSLDSVEEVHSSSLLMLILPGRNSG